MRDLECVGGRGRTGSPAEWHGGGAVRRRLVPGLLAALLVGAASHAQELQALRDEYVTESQLLDADLDSYLDVREQEEAALRRLVELGRQLDRAMGDASVPVSELIRLHETIAETRTTAFELSADAGRRREEMGQRMERMQAVLENLQREGVEYLDSNGEVGGTWLLESQDGLGLMSLQQRGGRATGSYRLSNGRHGTVRGSFRGRKLRVELEDSAFGPVGSLEGHLDDNGELNGQWSARELAGGRPTGGTWSGRRLSFEELLSLEP